MDDLPRIPEGQCKYIGLISGHWDIEHLHEALKNCTLKEGHDGPHMFCPTCQEQQVQLSEGQK